MDLSAIDQPGMLSIVLQGGLSADNLIQTAQHARHWRSLFPAAEIVLSISVSEAIAGQRGAGGRLSDITLTPEAAKAPLLRIALDQLLRACDQVVLSPGALPLPKIKNDSSINNANLQIEAARSGLAAASGRYALRFRADMIFADRSFLRVYADNAALPRGAAARLQQRVLISEYFTLNPFTLERLPLHVSDWFNFGLLDDVRALWTAPPISYRDAVHYRVHDHAPGSNRLERQFYLRLAVEQHLAFEAFKPFFPELRIDYHNDPASAELGCRILADNFILGDVRACRLYFEKYDHAKVDPEMPVKCITHADWLALVGHPDTPAAVLFRDKVKAGERLLDRRRFGPLWSRVPRWLRPV